MVGRVSRRFSAKFSQRSLEARESLAEWDGEPWSQTAELEALKKGDVDKSPFKSSSWGALFVQSLPLLLLKPVQRISRWYLLAVLWFTFINHVGMGRNIWSLIVSAIFTQLIMNVASPLLGILLKWLIVGRHKTGRYPLWGQMYLRVWLANQLLSVFGKGFFKWSVPFLGNQLLCMYYRLLGGKIGRNVKIEPNARIPQADLVTIGDNVTVDDALIQPAVLEAGHFLMMPIVIGKGSSVGIKSSVVAGSVLQPNTHVGPLSSSHELQDAKPENKKYCRAAFPGPSPWYIIFIGAPILMAISIAERIPWFFALQAMFQAATTGHWYVTSFNSVYDVFRWFTTPQRVGWFVAFVLAKEVAGPIICLLLGVLVKGFIIGEFSEGDRTKPWDLFRYWLASRTIGHEQVSAVAAIVGTHYEPVSFILRALGAKIGKRIYWPGSGIAGVVAWGLFEASNVL
jgi:carbonic anhydrase/acetyltransferase-like protein (isoleucine patch superfamily)